MPARWLHLTTQGIGFTDEVSDQDIAAMRSVCVNRTHVPLPCCIDTRPLPADVRALVGGQTPTMIPGEQLTL